MRAFMRLFVGAALCAAVSLAQVRISQIYGGGQGSGAGTPYANDYVELFNAGTTSVSLTGWSIQYQAAGSTGAWSGRINLSGSIAAGRYFLIQTSSAGTVGAALPTPDQAATAISMSATGGKVALVSSTTAVSTVAGPPVVCPDASAGVVDLVGYGTSPNCAEGSVTAGISALTAALRNGNGCTDTNNNSADFTIGTANPRNSATAANACGAPGLPTLSINDVSQAEGNAGTSTMTFTVSLSAPAGAGGVTFDIATADGTATVAGLDYVANSLTSQTIAAGQTAYTFTVTINGDTLPEPNETFFANVTNVTGATVGDGQGQGTIVNDDIILTTISTIQGSGILSPLNGSNVTTRGIITAKISNGYFIQSAPADVDSDPNTSEGLFVFTSSAPPGVVGDLVQVSGTVTEFVPSTDTNSRAITEIISPTTVVLSSGNTVPAAVTLPALTANGGIDQYERFEGMLVQVASLRAVTATDGTVAEANATASTNGVLYGVFPNVALPYREAGIEVVDVPASPATACAAGAGCALPVFDMNPERLRLDTDAVTGQTAINVNTGATLSDIVGVLHYGFRSYTVLTTAPVSVSGTQISLKSIPAGAANTVTIAATNVERLFDDVNDPSTSDVVLTTTAMNARLGKISKAIRDVLGTPDVVALEEVENLSVLQALAGRISTDAVTASQPNPGYIAFLFEGNDIGGIDVGFLVKSTVTVESVLQLGKTTTYTNPCSGAQDILNDRPPLRLRGSALKGGQTLEFTVFVNHLRSLNDVGATSACASGTDGNRVRTKRAEQGNYLTQLVQTELTERPSSKLVLVGDFNAFEVNDGYTDVIGGIMGTPAPATEVLKISTDPTYANLTNLLSLLPRAEQYSYVFDGNHQTLDHGMLNPAAMAQFVGGGYARVNADFNETLRGDFSNPQRYSDHDPLVVQLTTASNVTSQLGITRTAQALNRATGLYQTTVRITNNTGSALSGPLQLVITGLTEGAKITNAASTTPASAVYNVPVPLAPGATASVLVTFSLDAAKPVVFTMNVFSGGL